MVPLNVYNIIASSISSIELPEDDLLRIHLVNGYKFLRQFRDLYKTTDTLDKAAVRNAYTEMNTDMEKEKNQLTEFAELGLNQSSHTVASEEMCNNIIAFIDKVIPHMKPADHPVANHVHNTFKLLNVYRQVDQKNWKPDSPILRNNYDIMISALEEEWDKMDKLLQSMLEKAYN